MRRRLKIADATHRAGQWTLSGAAISVVAEEQRGA
jgi:hypothetical protein